jgi:hypothetical protein
MKNFRSVIIFLVCVGNLKAQVPADSLPGVYVGQFWLADPSTSPWVITPDTVYVHYVDSVLCKLLADDSINFSYGGFYYTDYYSCNGSVPSNNYMKFYSGDSLKLINNNSAQPPPNSPLSRRFFGKRISGLVTGIQEKDDFNIKIFPNPCPDLLSIIMSNLSINCSIQLFDILGREVLCQQLTSTGTEVHLNINHLADGIYTVQVGNGNYSHLKKLIIQH